MLPAIVQKVLGPHQVAGFRAWHDIQLQGSFGRARKAGYARKLAFMVAVADRDGHGLVATLDRDLSGGERLRELEDARRSAPPPVPVALGEADPHGEAWLIDDLEPLRRCLGLDAEAPRPDLKDAKAALDRMIDRAGLSESRLDTIQLVAESLALERCHRARDTGLHAFVEDLRDQFRA